MRPVRYFIINNKTQIMHIHDYCQQTKSRAIPIRLFDTVQELESYAGRPLMLCKACRKTAQRIK